MTLERNLKIMEMFKKEGNEIWLIDFLETMLKIKIERIEILPKENEGNIIYTKATLDDKTTAKIEIKFSEDIHIIKIPEQSNNQDNKNTVVVSILNENITD